MAFTYSEIPRISLEEVHRLREEFIPQKRPVVIENASKAWRANAHWDWTYLSDAVGNRQVPLYDDSYADARKKVNEPDAHLPFREYVQKLQEGSCSLRMFLFHMLKEVPDLQKDIAWPQWGLKLLKQLPMLFMGGQGSKVFMHYDIDWAEILHFQFIGKKRCILVAPEQSKWMYKVPFSVICREEIDFENPDFEQWPALKNVQPMQCVLEHGDCLYMPGGYWHFMHYLTPSASLSLRSVPRGKNLAKAVYNIFFVRNLDNLMRKLFGQKWMNYKLRKARSNAA